MWTFESRRCLKEVNSEGNHKELKWESATYQGKDTQDKTRIQRPKLVIIRTYRQFATWSRQHHWQYHQRQYLQQGCKWETSLGQENEVWRAGIIAGIYNYGSDEEGEGKTEAVGRSQRHNGWKWKCGPGKNDNGHKIMQILGIQNTAARFLNYYSSHKISYSDALAFWHEQGRSYILTLFTITVDCAPSKHLGNKFDRRRRRSDRHRRHHLYSMMDNGVQPTHPSNA